MQTKNQNNPIMAAIAIAGCVVSIIGGIILSFMVPMLKTEIMFRETGYVWHAGGGG